MTSLAPQRPAIGRQPACPTLILWSAFLFMHGYYFLLGLRNTPHPSYIPLLLLVSIQLVALLLATVFGTTRLLYGPNRIRSAAWLALGFLPAFLWYSQVSLTFHTHEERFTRQAEMSWYLSTTQPIASALIDGIARRALPYRLQGDRVVMFYDDKIPDPHRDLEEMDAFIKKEEAYLRITMPSRIHWIRGRMLGLSVAFALAGISVAEPGTSQSGDRHTVSTTDFHEASHNTIGVPSSVDVFRGTYPPAFLIEGWAMARTESWDDLAESCRRDREEGRSLSLQEAISPVFYNQLDNRLYCQGGAFVHVLLEKFGPEKFLELYRTAERRCVPERLMQIYGLSLEELDSLYWNEIESSFASKRSFEKAVEKCTARERVLLDELRRAYDRHCRNFENLCRNVTLEWEHTIKGVTFTQSEETRFQASGQCARLYQEFEWKKHSDGEPEESYRTLCFLLTRNAIFSTFQYSDAQADKNKENIWSLKFRPEERRSQFKILKRSRLHPFDPLSLFSLGHGHSFSDPDEYLWNPPLGTVIENVTEEGDDVLLTIKPPPHEMKQEQTLTLRFDRKQGWLLREARAMHVRKDDRSETERIDLREYDDEMTGFPITKKRSLKRASTNDDGGSSVSTEEFSLTRLDTAPVPDSVFLPANMPLDVEQSLSKELMSSEKRLRRHLGIALLWLAIPLAVIVCSHRLKPSPA